MADVRVCCVCQKSEHGGVWDKHEHHQEKIKKQEATHGYCPPCGQKVLDDYFEGKAK